MERARRTQRLPVRRIATHLPALVLLCAACAGEDSVIEPAIIEFYSNPLMIEAPSTARTGESFLVTVMAYGGGCIVAERTDVEPSDDAFDVIPLHRRHIPDEDGGCTQELRLFRHSVALAFHSAGNKTIRIQGRRLSFDLDQLIQVPLTLVVE